MSAGSSQYVRSAFIGKRLRAVREGLGLTQDEMAIKAEVSRPAINSLENGKGMVSLDSLARILTAYDLPWAFLDASCDHDWEKRCRICGEIEPAPDSGLTTGGEE